MITLNEELAVRLSGKKADELKTLISNEEGEPKDNAAELFADLVKDKFLTVERDRAENAYKRGIKEKAEAIEAALKPLFKAHGIHADKVEEGLTELSDKLKNVKPGKSGTTDEPQELTKDDIKKLPAYQELLDEDLSKVRAQVDEWKAKYSDFTSQVEREKVIATAREKALSILDGKNAVWGDDKARQLDFFFRAVGTDNLSINDKGELELLDSDGQPLRDDSRNRITFENFILDSWQTAGYRFHDAPPESGSAGARKPGTAGGSGGSSSNVKITSPEHYQQLLKEAGTDRGKRAEIHMAYVDFQKNNAE